MRRIIMDLHRSPNHGFYLVLAELLGKFTQITFVDLPVGLLTSCSPGRFFSAVVLKLMIAYMLSQYDCELDAPRGPVSTSWRNASCPKAGITLRVKHRVDSQC
jgi:hypothetical protein